VVSIGMLATLPLLALEPAPDPTISPEAVTAGLLWLGLAGMGYVLGMVLSYSALAGGKIPVAAPIVSTEGAVAAGIAVLTGEAVAAPLLLMLGVVALGVFLTALRPGGQVDVPEGGDARYVAFAVAAAASFGLGLYASGRASGSVPLAWVVAAGRVAGVGLVALPLVITRRLTYQRAALPFLVFSGLAEVVGLYTFAWGARDSIAVAAVLSSQFAVLAAILAHFIGERIASRQWLGIALVALGVTVIAVSRL
jgi:drug/metabolite transporter (DMT)-like permease